MRETGREQARNARLFPITEAEAKGPAVKHLAQERDAIAWSQALFCEVLIKKTNNFSFSKLANNKTKIFALLLVHDLSM